MHFFLDALKVKIIFALQLIFYLIIILRYQMLFDKLLQKKLVICDRHTGFNRVTDKQSILRILNIILHHNFYTFHCI